MKKYFVNENWELEEFDDKSDLFMLVVEQSLPTCSYVYKYDTSPETLQPDYTTFVNQFKETEVDGPVRIHLIKVPNTPQICSQMTCADSEHKGSTEEAIEAINNMLNRADCEILESWTKEPLTEKKHKRKRRKSRFGDDGTYLTFTTGYPELNDKFFNDRFGTSDLGGETSGESTDCEADCGGLGEGLVEAKREIKRYYVRPINKFAANKAEILKILATNQGINCSIYSLRSLEDHDDVHLLQPSDIIYYYDDGVLRDKNHVPVLDYDLSARKEEERAQIQPEKVSDERFKAVYDDRITKLTVDEALEETPLDDSRRFILYCHTNKINDKKYFGITSQKDYSRWRNGEGYKNQPIFYAAIMKYGWHNFDHEIVKTDLTEETAKKLEKAYIKKYHTYVNDPAGGGYNTTLGGESNLRYATEDERIQAQKASQHRSYLAHREARLAAAQLDYLDNPEKYSQKNKLKYAKNRDQYLKQDKTYQAGLLKKLEVIRSLNLAFPNRLSIEDQERIKNFRNCRNGLYLNKLLSLFTEQEIDSLDINLLTVPVDTASDEKLDNAYEDRLTEALKESDENRCIICGEEIEGYGNNPAPVATDGQCCDACNIKFVIPARLEAGKADYEDN